VCSSDLAGFREQFARRDQVEKVVSVADLIPVDQDEKLDIIDEMSLLLGDLSVAAQPDADTQSHGARLAALRAFQQKLQEHGTDDPVMATLRENLAVLLAGQDMLLWAEKDSRLRGNDGNDGNGGDSGNNGNDGDGATGGDSADSGDGSGSSNGPEKLARLEHALLASPPGRLDALNASLNADYISLDNLPAQLQRLWLSADGRRRIEIYPKQDMQDDTALTLAQSQGHLEIVEMLKVATKSAIPIED